jgi:(p)ppGpp synthase/HD superfamily hydrolase
MIPMDDLVEKAKAYAIKHHDDCGCKYNGEPYEKHLQDVYHFANVFIHMLPEEYRQTVLAAAWGHDLIEDCHLTYNDVKKALNKYVADLIYDVTNELGKNRKERAEKTYPKIKANKLAIYLKLCDRMANMFRGQINGNSMLKKYKEEYPLFKKMLYPNSSEYLPLWQELQFIVDFPLKTIK